MFEKGNINDRLIADRPLEDHRLGTFDTKRITPPEAVKAVGDYCSRRTVLAI